MATQKKPANSEKKKTTVTAGAKKPKPPTSNKPKVEKPRQDKVATEPVVRQTVSASDMEKVKIFMLKSVPVEGLGVLRYHVRYMITKGKLKTLPGDSYRIIG